MYRCDIHSHTLISHDSQAPLSGMVHAAQAAGLQEFCVTDHCDLLDLDGKPRPIHLKHGAANIQWERDTKWVTENLVNAVAPVYQGTNGIVERTGLHHREFLDTYRFQTESLLPVQRNGSVHMLNLVEGQRAILRSTQGMYAPFEVRYAETCIVPEAAGSYEIVSPDGEEIRMILACVRN